MGYDETLTQIAKEEKAVSEQYKAARIEATQAKVQLNCLLAKHIGEIRENKKNIGFDMAIVELIKDHKNEGAEEFYKIYENKTAEYKGYEKILNALEGARINIQSIMKWHLTGEIKGE